MKYATPLQACPFPLTHVRSDSPAQWCLTFAARRLLVSCAPSFPGDLACGPTAVVATQFVRSVGATSTIHMKSVKHGPAGQGYQS